MSLRFSARAWKRNNSVTKLFLPGNWPNRILGAGNAMKRGVRIMVHGISEAWKTAEHLRRLCLLFGNNLER